MSSHIQCFVLLCKVRILKIKKLTQVDPSLENSKKNIQARQAEANLRNEYTTQRCVTLNVIREFEDVGAH